jgi:Actinobacteria/chloroflexi VLRF1 release factor
MRICRGVSCADSRSGAGWPRTRSSWTSTAAYGLCVGQTRYIGRANLEKRLARLEGAAGRICYRDGSARLELGGETLTVTPPFGVGHGGEYAQVAVGPLLEALGEDHTVAALLVRLGGYAVGVFEGERLADSKVGSRFVKGRHRAGGSSANRFRRRREGQERELIEEAAAEAARVLAPWRATVERVALGGDRAAIRRVLAARPDLAWLEPLALERFFTVPEPRRRVLDELPYQLYAAKVVSTSASPSTE